MKRLLPSPLATMLGINNGQVPDHAFTTWLGAPIQDQRMILSVLWHSVDALEVRESIVRPSGVELLTVKPMDPQSFVQRFFLHHTIAPTFSFSQPFTSADPSEHVKWLAERGVQAALDPLHWFNPCLASAAPGDAGPADPWAKVKEVVAKSAQPAATTSSFVEICKGEQPYLHLVQDRPDRGRVLHFDSKRKVDGSIFGVFVGVNTVTGEATELTQVCLSTVEIDQMLKNMAGEAFTNGEKWVIAEAIPSR